ncbi:helix-turn-helix domain-containing protein [Gordonia neofelifaecis]|uniref:Helix-turn-helix domain-containing protein n=1 Tax=Gordonia neofelifaecis NRRL B-59395 TaxID=644548 RepID=F1YHA4_9ACTN|nr:helix-turn-helix domain-containing protein [Gordonia neofelifaecis]EGD55742.1 hypothetical protein SCNU_05860 [Gordonia neofelifaecis NRRL B-59395]
MPRTNAPESHDDLWCFSKTEVAERLGVSERTVDRLLAARKLTVVGNRRRGTTVKITARSLRKYMYPNG